MSLPVEQSSSASTTALTFIKNRQVVDDLRSWKLLQYARRHANLARAAPTADDDARSPYDPTVDVERQVFG